MFRKTFDSRIRCACDNICSLENMPLEEGSNVQNFVISVKEWNILVEKLHVETCRNSAPSWSKEGA